MAVTSTKPKWAPLKAAYEHARLERIRRRAERQAKRYPYLLHPEFTDPLDQTERLRGDPQNYNYGAATYEVPSPERIERCCALIRAYVPRPPIVKNPGVDMDQVFTVMVARGGVHNGH